MIHDIYLEGYETRVEGDNLVLGTGNSYGMEQLQLHLDENWREMVITATFLVNSDKAVRVQMDADGMIPVPPSATAGEQLPGTRRRIVFSGLRDGARRVSRDLSYMVLPHGPVNGGVEEPEELALIDQLMQQVRQLQAIAWSVREDAEAGKFNGPTGQPGPVGPVGPAGSVCSVAGIEPDAGGDVPLTPADIQALPITGGTMTGSLSMGGCSLTGLTQPGADTDAASKGYVDGKKGRILAVLEAALWAENTQTVGAAALTSDSDVVVSPAPASFAVYTENLVRCVSQGDGSLTFACESVPGEDVTVNILILN